MTPPLTAEERLEALARALYEAFGADCRWPEVLEHWPHLVPLLRSGWYAAARVAIAEATAVEAQHRVVVEALREASSLYAEFLSFLNSANEVPITLAFAHGWRCSSEDFAKGEDYRRRIQAALDRAAVEGEEQR